MAWAIGIPLTVVTMAVVGKLFMRAIAGGADVCQGCPHAESGCVNDDCDWTRTSTK